MATFTFMQIGNIKHVALHLFCQCLLYFFLLLIFFHRPTGRYIIKLSERLQKINMRAML